MANGTHGRFINRPMAELRNFGNEKGGKSILQLSSFP